MKNILIFGASEHAKCTIDILEQMKEHRIAGVLDDSLPKNSSFEGYRVLGKIKNLDEVMKTKEIQGGIIAIGDNYTRYRVCKTILELTPDFSFVSAVHPSAVVGKNVRIGPGSVIMPGVIIGNSSKIGKHTLLGAKSSVDHDSQVEDFSSFGPGCTTGGNVQVGFCSAICLSAGIIHGISVGEHTVIGAGSIVNRNVEDHILAYGIPARKVRAREEGDRYL